jgi:hypothetical protein
VPKAPGAYRHPGGASARLFSIKQTPLSDSTGTRPRTPINRLTFARVARKGSLSNSLLPSQVHGPRRIAGSNTPGLPSRAVKPARVRNVPAIPGARSALRRPPIPPDERRLRQMMASKRQCSLFRPPQLGDSNLLPNSNRIDLPEGPPLERPPSGISPLGRREAAPVGGLVAKATSPTIYSDE